MTLDNTFLCDITDLVARWMAPLRKPQSDPRPRRVSRSLCEVDIARVQRSDGVGAVSLLPVVGAPDAADAASPTIMLRTDVGGEWRRQTERDDASWRVGAAVDVTLSPTWNLSLGLTYRGGVRTAVDPFHGLVVEMTVAIDFKQ